MKLKMVLFIPLETNFVRILFFCTNLICLFISTRKIMNSLLMCFFYSSSVFYSSDVIRYEKVIRLFLCYKNFYRKFRSCLFILEILLLTL